MDNDKTKWLKRSIKYGILGAAVVDFLRVAQQGYFDVTGYIFLVVFVTIVIYYSKYKNYFEMCFMGAVVTILLGIIMLILDEFLSLAGISLFDLEIQLEQLQFMD